ncbi:MAG: phage holin family protein [Saprospiraceae bacterium]
MEQLFLEPLFLAQLNGIGNLVIVALAVLAGSYFLDGIWVKGFTSALIVAVVISVVNYFIGGMLKSIVSPIKWLPFDFAYMLVDAVLIYIAHSMLEGFKVKDFWSALSLAGIITLIQWFL